MDIINRSSRRTSDLRPMVAFVARLTGVDVPVTITDQKTSGYSTGGTADRVPSPHITLALSRALTYPCTFTAHVKALGATSVRTFAEEFVLVLAHEARHICQFNGVPRWFYDDAPAELEAERFALSAMKRWRRQHGRSTR